MNQIRCQNIVLDQATKDNKDSTIFLAAMKVFYGPTSARNVIKSITTDVFTLCLKCFEDDKSLNRPLMRNLVIRADLSNL